MTDNAIVYSGSRGTGKTAKAKADLQRHMQTSDLTHLVVTGNSTKVNKKERRKLRNMAYDAIRKNTKGRVSKGLIKQAAFVRSQKGFAMMEEIHACRACQQRFLKSTMVDGLCGQCQSISQVR